MTEKYSLLFLLLITGFSMGSRQTPASCMEGAGYLSAAMSNSHYALQLSKIQRTTNEAALRKFSGYKRKQRRSFTRSHGAIIRGDTSARQVALVFTGDEFGDGGRFIADVLKREQIRASFFLTGNFYRNKHFKPVIQKLRRDGNYLGSHSDRHLLYCDWSNRDSLLVSRNQFEKDLQDSYAELQKFNIEKRQARYFLPPYEWYNDSIAAWTSGLGLQLVNFTPGTRSNADYTSPEMGARYVDSKTVLQSVFTYEQKSASGLNGFILLFHIGTDPRRTDKFYLHLPELISGLKSRGYTFVKINQLLSGG